MNQKLLIFVFYILWRIEKIFDFKNYKKNKSHVSGCDLIHTSKISPQSISNFVIRGLSTKKFLSVFDKSIPRYNDSGNFYYLSVFS